MEDEISIIEKAHGFNKGGERSVKKFPALRSATSTNYKIRDKSKTVMEGRNSSLDSGQEWDNVYTGCAMRDRKIDKKTGKRNDELEYEVGQQRLEFRDDCKSNCLTSVSKDSLIGIDDINYRKLTVVECCRLQGVPDNYCDSVSKTQGYKMLGNGWQVDTIMHIFQYLKDNK